MGKIVSNFFISLDGVVESPDTWHFPYFDDEMGDAIGNGMETTDALLMGRVLYEEWAELLAHERRRPIASHLQQHAEVRRLPDPPRGDLEQHDDHQREVAARDPRPEGQHRGRLTCRAAPRWSAGCWPTGSSTG